MRTRYVCAGPCWPASPCRARYRGSGAESGEPRDPDRGRCQVQHAAGICHRAHEPARQGRQLRRHHLRQPRRLVVSKENDFPRICSTTTRTGSTSRKESSATRCGTARAVVRRRGRSTASCAMVPTPEQIAAAPPPAPGGRRRRTQHRRPLASSSSRTPTGTMSADTLEKRSASARDR